MAEALSLARQALGNVSPNPAVGAVVVKDGEIAGKGYTHPPGQAHAEVMALRQAGDKALGATLYVTLEPCCHYGRTPPCSKAIIEAGIKEVHAAVIDDNPLVLGKGVRELESAGIKVITGEHAEEARVIIEAYSKYITTGMPFVTVKYAASIDGRIATRSGDSKWITGEASRRCVHEMRRISDAVMVGVNTVIKDDPQLTARDVEQDEGEVKQPLRIVIDSSGRTPLSARMFKEPGKTLIALGRKATDKEKAYFSQAGSEIVVLPGDDDKVDLTALLKILGEREITGVLVEGGGTLIGSLFDEGLVDKVVAFIAPKVVGGEKATSAVGGKGIERIADAAKLTRLSVERFDDDLMVSGYVEH